MKVVHVPCSSVSDPLPAPEELLPKLAPHRSICLVATAQHLNRLREVAAFLEAAGKKVYFGGQILGCNQRKALKAQGKVDCFLYIGSGRFHPLGLALKTGRPVFLFNPISGVLDQISVAEKKSWMRKAKGRLMKAAAAETFGILVSTKDGQFNLRWAEDLRRKLAAAGKRAFIFAGEELSPGNLLPFKVDAWVNTACPRIVDDEHERPVLNPDELEVLLS